VGRLRRERAVASYQQRGDVRVWREPWFVEEGVRVEVSRQAEGMAAVGYALRLVVAEEEDSEAVGRRFVGVMRVGRGVQSKS
jgi:hypothetical protein